MATSRTRGPRKPLATSRTRGPRKPLIEIPPIQTEAIVAAQNLGDILSTPEGQAPSLKAQEAGRYLGLLEATKAALDVARFEDMPEKAQKIQEENKALEDTLDSTLLEMSDSLKAEKAISAASDKRAQEKASLVEKRDATIASLKSQVEQARNSASKWEDIATTSAIDCDALATRNKSANSFAFAFGMLALSGLLLQVGDYYRPADKSSTIAAVVAGIVSLLTFARLLLDKLMDKLVADDPAGEEAP